MLLYVAQQIYIASSDTVKYNQISFYIFWSVILHSIGIHTTHFAYMHV